MLRRYERHQRPPLPLEDYAIYLDMDGVVADYDGRIKELGFNIDPTIKNNWQLNRSGTDNPFKREMYEAIKGTDFYARLPFYPGAVELYRAVSLANPIFLTASPKFGATEDNYYLNPHWLGAAYHKRWWVEHRLLPAVFPSMRSGHMGPREEIVDRIPIKDEEFICTTSARKQEFLFRKHSDHQILIDDRRDNCVRWARAGGIAILHVSAEQTIEALQDYLAGGETLVARFTRAPGGGLVAGLDDVRTWNELEAAGYRVDS